MSTYRSYIRRPFEQARVSYDKDLLAVMYERGILKISTVRCDYRDQTSIWMTVSVAHQNPLKDT